MENPDNPPKPSCPMCGMKKWTRSEGTPKFFCDKCWARHGEVFGHSEPLKFYRFGTGIVKVYHQDDFGKGL